MWAWRKAMPTFCIIVNASTFFYFGPFGVLVEKNKIGSIN